MTESAATQLDRILEEHPDADASELAERLLEEAVTYDDLRQLALPLVRDLAVESIVRRTRRWVNIERRRREEAWAAITLDVVEPGTDSVRQVPTVP